MRIFFVIITGISLLILACGTIAYVLDGPTFGGGCILVAAWAALTVLAIVIVDEGKSHARRGTKHADSEEQAKRLTECEGRLRDLQDIALANDEKIERLERETLVTPIQPQTIRD